MNARWIRAVTLAAFVASPALAFAQDAAPSATPAPTIRGGGVTVEIDKDRPTPPDGDPRSTDERRENRIAFNQCVLKMQGQSNVMLGRAAMPPDPLMYCQQRLGMQNADSVPQSVKNRMK
jgi:hypothetical protein